VFTGDIFNTTFVLPPLLSKDTISYSANTSETYSCETSSAHCSDNCPTLACTENCTEDCIERADALFARRPE